MDYQKFERQLIEELKQLDPEAEVILNPVLRNNDIEQNALLIVHQGETCVPNIYVSSLYDHFRRNNLSVTQSAEYAMQLSRKFRRPLNAECLLEEKLMDFEKMKKHLTIRMVNREKNRKLLEEVINIPFLDLAGIVYLTDSLDSMTAGIRVTRHFEELWSVGAEELKELALHNLKQQADFTLYEIGRILSEFSEYPVFEKKEKGPELYVLTDTSRRNGPAVLFFPEILKEMADEIGDDLLLLPSSTHELIVLRSVGVDARALQQIVMEINSSVVDPEDVLGSSIYHFGREQSKITVAA